MSASAWRVALLEDDADTREYFAACIDANARLDLAAAFATIGEARAWFAMHDADAFLTDLSLPDGHALELIRELALLRPACEILVISVFGDEESVLACVEAGAVGYVHKDSRPADVAQVVIDVKEGASPISPMIARRLFERLRRSSQNDPAARPASPAVALTPRESDVLELIARGYGYAEIARLKGVSMHTVQSHIKNLYSKLAVHSRSEAVFEASRMGLLGAMRPGA